MGKIVAAVVVILAGVALATGGTVALVSASSPDRTVELDNAPAANGAGGVVDYGTVKR